jgi:hypothetical protein
MIIVRCIIGFFRTLVRLWDNTEWFYYNRTGLDPKLPAYQRWNLTVRAEDKTPETEAERVLPVKNYTVVLQDKYMLTSDEIIFFSTDKDKVDALQEKYERELKHRTSGDFYYEMIRNRRLDFYHNYRIPTGEVEAAEPDEQTRRDMFNR